MIRLRFHGASAAPRVVGQDELLERANYFKGPASAWQTDIPTYARVAYENVYPGISLAFYGTSDRRLEYDLILKPGADLSSIRLSFAGAVASTLDAQNRLVLQTAGGGTVIQNAPVLYQTIDGRRREVTGRHQLYAGGQVGFHADRWDSRFPLVVDPSVNYSSYIGGSGTDIAEAVAVDASGNIYLAGTTTSSDFPRTDETPYNGFGDAFVLKLDPTGKNALFSTLIGGYGDDSAYDLAVDVSGDVFLTGKTAAGFPAGYPVLGTPGGGGDAYVARLSGAGDALRYVRYYGGTGPDEGRGIDVDVEGSVFVTGKTWKTTGVANYDAFALKLSPDETTIVYDTGLAGTGDDWGEAIAVDPSGQAFVVGRSFSGDFLSTNPGWDKTRDGPSDGFLARLDPLGVVLAASYLGGMATTAPYVGEDEVTDVALGLSGDLYVSGWTTSRDDPGTTMVNEGFPTRPTSSPLPFQTTHGGGLADGFVAKFSPDLLVEPAYSSFYGGAGLDVSLGVAVDPDGQALLSGYTDSSNLPLADPFEPSFKGGAADAFIAQVKTDGSALVLSSYLGGIGDDRAFAIARDFDGGIYVTGYSTAPGVLPGANPLLGSVGGGWDAFVSRVGGPVLPQFTGVAGDDGESTLDGITSQQVVGFSTKADPNSTVTISREGFGVVGTVPAGTGSSTFSPSATLAPGASATFAVRYDGTCCLPNTGAITFANSDINENPFDILVAGSICAAANVQYGEDERPGFYTTGVWDDVGGSGGLEQDYYKEQSTTTAGDTATWVFQVSPGRYKVLATWEAIGGQASNAPYSIYDGNTLLATVTVDQRQVPGVTMYVGVGWRELSSGVIISSGILKVTLAEGDGPVVADGVRIERIGNVSGAEVEVLDGTTLIPDNAGAVDFGATPVGTSVSKTFTVKNVGTSDLTLGAISVPSGFTVTSGWNDPHTLPPGNTIPLTVRLDATAAGNPSGQVSFTTGDAEENPFNFSVTGWVAPIAPVIIDDGDSGFTTTGSWTVESQGHLGDARSRPAGSGSNAAAWTFTGLGTGRYRVSATWREEADRATNAVFRIYDGATLWHTIAINQRAAPNDFAFADSMWEVLDDFAVVSDTMANYIKVELTDAANGKVLADAVRIESIGPLPPAEREIQVLDGAADLTDGVTVVNFGTTAPVTKTFTVKNVGRTALVLNTPITVPPGFTLLTSYAGTVLPEGTYAFTATASLGGQTGEPSAPQSVTVDRTPPTITLDAPTTTYDTTPEVRVTAFDLGGLPNDSANANYKVFIDVDLDRDGTFAGNEVAAAAQGLAVVGTPPDQYGIPVPAPAESRRKDGLEHLTRWTLDYLGRPLTQTAANGGRWTYQRQAGSGWLTAVTDALGRATTYTLDTKGYVTQELLSDLATRQYVYDQVGLYHSLLTATDERGNVSSFTYDTLSRPESGTNALGQAARYTWTTTTDGPQQAEGLLKQAVDPRGNTATYYYDSFRRLVAMTEGLAPLDAGTSSGGNTNLSLNDTTRSWTTNIWRDLAVILTAGKGAGQKAEVLSNTATTLTLKASTAWTDIPDNASTYAILAQTGRSSDTPFLPIQLNDISKNWEINAWSGRAVVITGGPGAGLVARPNSSARLGGTTVTSRFAGAPTAAQRTLVSRTPLRFRSCIGCVRLWPAMIRCDVEAGTTFMPIRTNESWGTSWLTPGWAAASW